MDTQKQQIVDRLKQANNILVTVSNNPSVDQLAACIGLTLALNKMKKHATAVFSGSVPPIIGFLQPEKTLEKTTDSLRDFIIAIDKAKADKLRYKVEDKFVKIFITPYRTSISEKDLEFSEGDFNVDVVLALGVHRQSDLDQAITAHGRILHDAAVISVNTQPNVELGSLNLLDTQASSLSEIAVNLLDLLDKSIVDDQIATTLLTGIVAETDRFRNARTSPTTMSISAELLTAGANQQLVASKLESSPPSPPPSANQPGPSNGTQPPPNKPDDGTLEINHEDGSNKGNATPPPSTEPSSQDDGTLDIPKPPQIHIDDDGHVRSLDDDKPADNEPKITPLPSLPPLPPQPMSPAPAPLPAMEHLPMPGSMPFSDATPKPTDNFGLPPQPMSPAPAPYASPGLPSPMLPPEPATPTPAVEEPPSSLIQPDPNADQATKQEVEPPLPPIPPKVEPPAIHNDGAHMIMQPPTFNDGLTAGAYPQDDEESPSGAALSLPQVENPAPILDRLPLQSPAVGSPVPAPASPPIAPSVSLPPPPPPKDAPSPITPVLGGGPIEPPLLAEEALSSLERDVKSPHLDYIEAPVPNLPPPPVPTVAPPVNEPVAESPQKPVSTEPVLTDQDKLEGNQEVDVANARNAINAAFDGGDDNTQLEPVTALNAKPLGAPLHEEEASAADVSSTAPPPGFTDDPHNGGTPPPSVPPPFIPGAPA